MAKAPISEFDNLSPAQEAIAKQIHSEAKAAGVDPEFALATAWQENRFRPQGKSSAGALGPMQIMPSTAKLYGVKLKDLTNPSANIKLGVQILKDNLDRYDGDKELALIAYNAGPKVADKYMQKPDSKILPKETQHYISSINEYHPIETHHPVEGDSNPFDELLGGAPEDLGDFGDTEQLPEHLKKDTGTTPPEPSIMEDIGRYLFGQPEVPLAGAAGAYGQSAINTRMNENAMKQQLDKTIGAVNNLEQQLKMQPPAEPNMDRVLQGRTEEGLTGRQRQSYNDITSARAAQARQQQQVLDELARRGQIAPDYRPRIMSQAMPTESTPSGVIYSGQRLNEEQRRLIEEAERNKPAIQRVRESVQNRVLSPLAKVGGFGATKVLGPLSTGLMTANVAREYEKANRLEAEGDLLGSKIARFNAYASGLGAIPTTPFAPLNVLKGIGMVGTGAGTLLEAGRNELFPYKSVVKP